VPASAVVLTKNVAGTTLSSRRSNASDRLETVRRARGRFERARRRLFIVGSPG
jgi:hypothetical protein